MKRRRNGRLRIIEMLRERFPGVWSYERTPSGSSIWHNDAGWSVEPCCHCYLSEGGTEQYETRYYRTDNNREVYVR